MSQASDRFNIDVGQRVPRARNRGPFQGTRVQSDRFNIDIPVRNFIPTKSQTDSRFDIITDSDVARYAHHKKPEYRATDDRFGSVDVPPVREEKQGPSDRFASVEVEAPAERRRERTGPSDRFAAVEMQDPRRMVRGDAPQPTKISIRNQFSELIESAIVNTKTIAPVPVGGAGSDTVPVAVPAKKKQEQKKKNKSNLDDLDDDRVIDSAANKAIIALLAAEEGEDEDKSELQEEDTTQTQSKKERRRERLIASGRGSQIQYYENQYGQQ